jgi:PST family polysaccharide transporter
MKSGNALIGTTAMATASGLRVAIQIVILPIIGRVLGPHAYGQIALVGPFIFFSMLLAESGLGASIVRADRASAELKGTVFCFATAFSLLFMLLFALLAYPLGYFLGEPSFPALLMAMSSILLLASFNIVPTAILVRDKRYKWIAASDIASTFGGIAAVTGGILLDWGVWSLVAQQIAFWICKVGIVALGARWWPQPVFKWSLIRENIYFGSNLTGASILGFISRNIDNILIGTFMGAVVLGHYALAFQIVGLPSMVLSGSVYYTLFSGTSEAQRAGTHSAMQFLRILRGVLLISAPTMIGLAATASLSVPLVLGDKWTPTAMLIVLLTPLGLGQSIGAVTSGLLIGLGRSDTMFRLSLISSGLTIFAILIGVFIGSSSAVALGVSLAAIINVCIAMPIVARQCHTSLGTIGKTAAVPMTAALLMGGIVVGLQYIIPGTLPLALRLLLCIGSGVIAYGAVLFGLFRDQIAADVEMIKSAVMRVHMSNRT